MGRCLGPGEAVQLKPRGGGSFPGGRDRLPRPWGSPWHCFPAPSRSQPAVQASGGDHPGTAAEHPRPALRAGLGRWVWAMAGGCGPWWVPAVCLSPVPWGPVTMGCRFWLAGETTCRWIPSPGTGLTGELVFCAPGGGAPQRLASLSGSGMPWQPGAPTIPQSRQPLLSPTPETGGNGVPRP